MAKTSPVNRKQTVEQAFAKILRKDMALVQQWEPIALAGKDTEGVHQMRVGLRRMRSALTLFRPAIPRKITTPLAKEMRWAAHQLDHARDLDVYIEENFLKNGGKQRRGEKQMLKIASQDREKTYQQVRDFITGKRFTAFERQVSYWLEAKDWRSQLANKQRNTLKGRITPFAAQVLEQHRAQVLEDGKDIRRLDADALHQLRIDCKKLRYATEFFDPLYGKSMIAFTQHLKGLQDMLGTLHDSAVMKGLQKNLLKGHKNPNMKYFTGKLEGQRSKDAKKLIATLEQRWKTFSKTKPPWRAALA